MTSRDAMILHRLLVRPCLTTVWVCNHLELRARWSGTQTVCTVTAFFLRMSCSTSAWKSSTWTTAPDYRRRCALEHVKLYHTLEPEGLTRP